MLTTVVFQRKDCRWFLASSFSVFLKWLPCLCSGIKVFKVFKNQSDGLTCPQSPFQLACHVTRGFIQHMSIYCRPASLLGKGERFKASKILYFTAHGPEGNQTQLPPFWNPSLCSPPQAQQGPIQCLLNKCWLNHLAQNQSRTGNLRQGDIRARSRRERRLQRGRTQRWGVGMCESG